jgi:uncharacterized protein YutD
VEGGWKLKFVLFYGDNSRTAALRQTKFGTVKGHGHTYCFYMKNYFVLQKLLNMTMVRHFVVMLGQTLNHSV